MRLLRVFFVGIIFIPRIVFGQVVVENLTPDFIGSIGTLKTIPFDTWGDLPNDLRMQMIDAIIQTKSPALLNALVQVLNQRTQISNKNEQNWFLIRLKGLLRSGDFQSVEVLMNEVPPTLQTDEMRLILSQAYLLSGQIEKACMDTSFSEDLNLVCLIKKGQNDAAALSLTMREEEGKTDVLTKVGIAFLNGDQVNVLPADMTPFILSILGGNASTFYQTMGASNVALFHNNTIGLNSNAQNISWCFYVLSEYSQIINPNFIVPKLPENTVDESVQITHNFHANLLIGKTENQITGDDVLTALYLLTFQNPSVEASFLILNKVWLKDVADQWVAEQVTPCLP